MSRVMPCPVPGARSPGEDRKPTILVIGGSGMLGAPRGAKLATDGFGVRLLARNPADMKSRFADSFEIVSGNVEDAGSIRRALAGCVGVHVNLMGGPRPDDFDRHLRSRNGGVLTDAG